MMAVAADIKPIMDAQEEGARGNRDNRGYRRLWVSLGVLVCLINALARGPYTSTRANLTTGAGLDVEAGYLSAGIALDVRNELGMAGDFLHIHAPPPG